MGLQAPLTEYYEITFESNGTGGQFEFVVAVTMPGKYTGTGSELGNGNVSGTEQLKALAKGIAAGIRAKSAPQWDNIKIKAVDGHTVGRARLDAIPPDA